MILHHKRKLLVLLAVAAIIVTGVAFNYPHKQGHGYKNLKVLPADITHDSLKILMEEYSDALGVKCNFCHAPQKENPQKLDFASDEKHEKDITRHMIKMTMGINKDYFNFSGSNKPDTIRVVGCITCHRGDAHPEFKELYKPRKQEE
ncbi:c-type cytochrome [Foetidibacter luteolus]|uniref:c-type cytochrome n=1 Tax=Foetidibacter luteolus TaxID=2608880 RepID=UPI00129B8521|nr:c-type cytochrome [Foetidibacter luteolus]